MKFFKKLVSFLILSGTILATSSCSALFEDLFNTGVNVVLDSGSTLNISLNDNETVIEEGSIITPDEVNLSLTCETYNNSSIFNTKYAPSVRNTKILVIPIDFTGTTSFYGPSIYTTASSTNKEVIKTAFFDDGSSSSLCYESVTSYYKKSSNGLLNINGTVTDWYNIKNSGYTSYTQINSDDVVIDLMNDAIEYFDIDTTEYDSNKDGYIDSIWLIYNFMDYSTASEKGYKINDNFWAYTYWDQSDKTPSVDNPVSSGFSWASFDFIRQTSNTTIDTHTFIHETGHQLGLNDYYDYSKTASPIGGLDMMDANVGDHNLYSKMCLNWTTPYIVNGSATISFNKSDLINHPIVILNDGKSLNYNDGLYQFNPFDEYIMIEYYEPSGLNKADGEKAYTNGYKCFTNSGFKVYHVDSRLCEISVTTNITGRKVTCSMYDDSKITQNHYLMQIISNSFSGVDSSESEKINTLKENGYDTSALSLSNYYSEILLIDQTNKYTYQTPYVSSSSYTRTSKIVSATNSALFESGDTFSLSTYKNYFKSQNKFDNNLAFSSNVIFC